MKIKIYERNIVKLENDAIRELDKRIKKFCDKYNLKFIAGNGVWLLEEVNPPESYYDSYDEYLYDENGGTSVFEDYQKRKEFIKDKFKKIYDDSHTIAHAFRLDGSFLMLCNDYEPKLTSSK